MALGYVHRIGVVWSGTLRQERCCDYLLFDFPRAEDY